MFTTSKPCYICTSKTSQTCVLCTQYFCKNQCQSKLCLSSKQKILSVCINCSNQELNLATHHNTPPLRTIRTLSQGLLSLQTPFSGKHVLETICRGRNAYLRISQHPDKIDGKFNSLQEVVDFSWFLVASSANKNQQFTSGIFLFEDPNYNVFQALSKHGYSRVLSSVAGLVNEKKSFGSSHFIDYILFSRSRGGWYVPEEKGSNKKKQKSKSKSKTKDTDTDTTATDQDDQFKENTVNGYEQIGIDLRIKDVDEHRYQNIGVYLKRRHLLCGKLPKKKASETRQFTFIKLESYGTKTVSEAVGHSISFLKTRRDRGRSSPSNSTTTTETMDDVNNSNEKNVIVKQRKEHTPKICIVLFNEIMTLVHGDRCSTMTLYDSLLIQSEILTKRPKILGLSFMNLYVKEIHTNVNAATTCVVPQRLIECIREWKEMIASNEWDHMDIRFGEEVIASRNELLDFAGYLGPKGEGVATCSCLYWQIGILNNAILLLTIFSFVVCFLSIYLIRYEWIQDIGDRWLW